jgi:hypothetical protein
MAKVKDVITFLTSLNPDEDILSVIMTRKEFDEWAEQAYVATQSKLVWLHFLQDQIDGTEQLVSLVGPAATWKERTWDIGEGFPFYWDTYVEELGLMHYEVDVYPSDSRTASPRILEATAQDMIDERVKKLIIAYDDLQEFEEEMIIRSNKERGIYG